MPHETPSGINLDLDRDRDRNSLRKSVSQPCLAMNLAGQEARKETQRQPPSKGSLPFLIPLNTLKLAPLGASPPSPLYPDRCREQEVDTHKRHIYHKKTILRFLCILWLILIGDHP